MKNDRTLYWRDMWGATLRCHTAVSPLSLRDECVDPRSDENVVEPRSDAHRSVASLSSRHPGGCPGSTCFANDTPRPSRGFDPEGLAGGKPSELVEGGKTPPEPTRVRCC
jgi:hypothetical protein